MPKSYPGRNVAEAINRRFRQVFPPDPAVSARFLKMAVREALKTNFAALRVEEFRTRYPRDHRADGGHGDPGGVGGLRERGETILRARAQDLVIVAAGNDGLDADAAAREQCRSGRRQG